MSTLVAILAAGRGVRFGGGKLDAPCAGKPVGQWVVDAVTAAGAAPGLIVTGPDAPDFAQTAMWDGWALVANPAPEDGIGTSVAIAARHAECMAADALVLLLADMPLIGAEMIRRLTDTGDHPVALRYPGDRPGVPARFPATMFADLADLTGDRGAAALLHGRADIRLIDGDPAALTDVDDPASLTSAQALLQGR